MTKQMQPTRKLAANLWVKKNKISFLKKEFRLKNYKNIIALILGVFLLSASQANAEGKWWEKGINIFKTQNKISKEPSIGEIGEAFKVALRIGSENVVKKLGDVDGFKVYWGTKSSSNLNPTALAYSSIVDSFGDIFECTFSRREILLFCVCSLLASSS